MKPYFLSFGIAATLLVSLGVPALAELSTVIPVYDKTVYYDGYNDSIFDGHLDDGILRLRNSIYSRKLTDDLLAQVGDTLMLDVVLEARCDNYDRIASFNIALVPKGQQTYTYDDVERIEIARYITPFMDKNVTPDTVPYRYDITGVDHILRDAGLREKYDLWLESDIFGIPYAAWEQVKGCDDDGTGKKRQDVFSVTARFQTNDAKPLTQDNVLVPIYCRKPEFRGEVNFNNHNEQACDTLGVTTRTWKFTVPEDCADAKIVLINSNHGANAGGEEYIRRLHIVYYDNDVAMTFIPGGVSCEPYRKYNTQPNGIYSSYRPESFWVLYSNWCPGQAVPTREIHLGAVKAGEHSFMIRVPKAVFQDKQGDFRPSIYFQGVKKGNVPFSDVEETFMAGPDVKIMVSGRTLTYECGEALTDVRIYSFDAQLLFGDANPSGSVSLAGYQPGVYLAVFMTADGRSTVRKIML